MMRWLAAAILSVTLPGLSAAAPPRGLDCPVPEAVMASGPLPGTATALFQGDIRILLIGSAMTSTGGASASDRAWPDRLAQILTGRRAETLVEIRREGLRGSTAADHARLLDDVVPAFRPNLVIWQLGTVEAVRSLSAEDMADTVQTAAARLRETRAERTDLILMDPQFSRFLRANADVETYREKLSQAATASGAALFSRWVVMKHWVEMGGIDLERAPPAQRAATADRLHECIARALADFLLGGTR
jgi:lysophospholipase L1-like esterase